MAFPEDGVKFKKGESGNPSGRPKKFVTLLKEQGYKQSEVNDTIQSMLSLSIDELKQIHDDSDATILEKTIANALYKSWRKGSLYSIETLLTRTYGKPKETIDIDADVNFSGIEIEIVRREIKDKSK
jgi:hypothetical protein